jgi:hypothetical protein
MTQPEDLDLEAPEADAAEQAVDTEPEEYAEAPSDSIEAPDWDAQEQSRIVPLEDDYR